MHYANSLGLIGYYVSTCLLRQKPRQGLMVKVYDSTVAPMTRFAEQFVTPAVRPVRHRHRPPSRLLTPRRLRVRAAGGPTPHPHATCPSHPNRVTPESFPFSAQKSGPWTAASQPSGSVVAIG